MQNIVFHVFNTVSISSQVEMNKITIEMPSDFLKICTITF